MNPSCQFPEVSSGVGDHVVVQTEDNSSNRFPVDLEVELDDGGIEKRT
jgi:hypothetical protein